MYRVILSVGLRQGLQAEFRSQEFGSLAGAVQLVKDVMQDQPKLGVSFRIEVVGGDVLDFAEWNQLLHN